MFCVGNLIGKPLPFLPYLELAKNPILDDLFSQEVGGGVGQPGMTRGKSRMYAGKG